MPDGSMFEFAVLADDHPFAVSLNLVCATQFIGKPRRELASESPKFVLECEQVGFEAPGERIPDDRQCCPNQQRLGKARATFMPDLLLGDSGLANINVTHHLLPMERCISCERHNRAAFAGLLQGPNAPVPTNFTVPRSPTRSCRDRRWRDAVRYIFPNNNTSEKAVLWLPKVGELASVREPVGLKQSLK